MDGLLLGAADGPPNQESLAICSRRELVIASRRTHPSREQRTGDSSLPRVAAGYIHAHQLALEIEKEELAAITSPARLRTAV